MERKNYRQNNKEYHDLTGKLKIEKHKIKLFKIKTHRFLKQSLTI